MWRYGWLVLCWCSGLAMADPMTIRVGAYPFPPFVDLATSGEVSGLTPDMLAVLNDSQDRYRFELVLTSPNRRFQDFAAGRFDMILFEDPRWGWANTMMDASLPILRDGDVFVTARQADRDQSYFNDLRGKRLYAIRGYHYAFAGFDADPESLQQRFRIELLDPRGPSLDRGLQHVAGGQAELMVITASYLAFYFQQRPVMRERLLMANRFDSEYQLGALVRRQLSLTAAGLDALLNALRERGELETLTRRYGVSEALLTPASP